MEGFLKKFQVRIKGLNPKHEYLNPKQIRNSNDQMFKTKAYYLPTLF